MFMLEFVVMIDMIETRQILKEQLRLKLYKNLRTTSLGKNLLVLIKKTPCISTPTLRKWTKEDKLIWLTVNYIKH